MADTSAPRPTHLRPHALLAVAVGGVAGTCARYGAAHLHPVHAGQWPWATFAVNILGAFLLGLLLEALTRLGPDSHWRQRARLLLGTGFLGSFTTYSAFAVEADQLLRGGHPALAAAYTAATLLVGLVATAAGIAVGNLVRPGLAEQAP